MYFKFSCLLVFGLLLSCFSAAASGIRVNKPDTVLAADTIMVPDSLANTFTAENLYIIDPTSPDSANPSKYKTKKRIAAILSFPFPFGLLGLHRVFLGTKPYIPFVYIGTLGGCFLILPIIDFVAILSANEETFKKYENNPKVFMWSH